MHSREYITQRTAAAEALEKFKAATADRKRARIIALDYSALDRGEPHGTDVTEAVVDLLDMITQSMDWVSHFWTDHDLPSFIRLCKLLKFEEIPGT